MIPLRRIDSEIIRFGRAAHQLDRAIATYDAEFRAGFDRKITDWAIDFITRCKKQGTPFYAYLQRPSGIRRRRRRPMTQCRDRRRR